MRRVAVASATALLALQLATAGSAAAQPALTAPISQPPPVAPQPDGELSGGMALALSLGGTAAAYGLIVVGANAQDDATREPLTAAGVLGTFFAPSFGHWYAHSFATRGMKTRGVASAVILLGGLIALSECPLFESEPGCNSDAGDALLIAGLVGYLGGTLDDIVTAPGKARAYNERARGRNVALIPLAHRDAAGVAFAGSF